LKLSILGTGPLSSKAARSSAPVEEKLGDLEQGGERGDVA